MRNAANYYVEPKATSVAVALLPAKIKPDLTADLNQVYVDPDPQAYPLSSYSYMVIPKDTTANFNTEKGRTQCHNPTVAPDGGTCCPKRPAARPVRRRGAVCCRHWRGAWADVDNRSHHPHPYRRPPPRGRGRGSADDDHHYTDGRVGVAHSVAAVAPSIRRWRTAIPLRSPVMTHHRHESGDARRGYVLIGADLPDSVCKPHGHIVSPTALRSASRWTSFTSSTASRLMLP